MKRVLMEMIDIIVYVLMGALASWYFYYYKKKAIIGGFWVGALVGIIGAVIVFSLTGTWFIELVNILMNPEKTFGIIRVNLIAAVGGAFLFVYIINRLNHDKNRR